ncbi:MAG TPA: site-specific integrase [Sphingomicrobium sp.]|nr:site-specific integrase [Sphingomicrobium sp.]
MSVRKRPGSPYFHYSFNLDSRRFRGSTGKTSKREAEEVERDQRHLARQGLIVTPDWPLLAVLNAYWHEHGSDRRGHKTIFANLAALQSFLGKDKRTSHLSNGDLMDYRARRRGQGVQHHTVNRELAYLRAAYEHCARFHGQPLPKIDWKKLKAKEPPGRTRFLSRAEYARLMEAAHPGIRPIILCAVTTGLRKDNILSLDWSQVKLEERLIQLTVKGNKRHTVKITPPLMAALSTMPHRKGRVFDTRNFRKRWDAALAAAELDDVRFHDTRHTFASWARMAGADLADIKEALGHSTVQMTMRYAHIKPDEAVTAFDRVSQSLGHNFGLSGSESGGKLRKDA